MTGGGIDWRYRVTVARCAGRMWERHGRWLDEGTLRSDVRRGARGSPERDAQREHVLLIDSTIVRVHQHLPAHWLVARGDRPASMVRPQFANRLSSQCVSGSNNGARGRACTAFPVLIF
ncbi:conserved hypothetical protein [Rhodococcus jostii RHA1]|uniref:Transposase n=1 Tax=Rhodococcus jostii (strain RHA1) TaxID=101510 RepID=Q0SDE1_RHOJR|nr:conserved hypothetical protein [Rhodococcus jostii RHA1]